MGPTERLLHDMHTCGTFVLGHAARISGPVTESIVRQAFDAVQRRHPLLGVHVSGVGHDFVSDGTGPVPLRVVARDSEDRWQRVFEDELNAPIPYGAHPLIRAVLLTDGRSPDHELVLISSHAIIDGAGGVTLLRDLMNACVAAHEGRRNPDESLEPVPALEALLPAWMYEKRVRPRFKVSGILPIDRRVAPSRRRSRVLFRVVDRQEVARLSAKCREQECTVNAALCAAGLRACCEVGRGDQELGLSTNVSLRERLTPPVAVDHLGTYISSVHTHHRVASRSEFWSLAREIKAAIGLAIERVEYLENVDTIRWGGVARLVARHLLPRMRAGRLHALNLTNVGRIPYEAEFGPFRVAAYFAASSQHRVGSSMQVAVQTLGGAMCIAFVYADPTLLPARGQQFVEAFEAQVRGALEGGPGYGAAMLLEERAKGASGG
jgi:NRPS condensation-like uncharacterized protein